jgi:Ca2+-binding EF-hand superfamily protein
MSQNTVSDSVIEERVKAVMEKYDLDQDGTLCRKEVRTFLGDVLKSMDKSR